MLLEELAHEPEAVPQLSTAVAPHRLELREQPRATTWPGSELPRSATALRSAPQNSLLSEPMVRIGARA